MTTTIRESFINTYGTDVVIAYFDPGQGYTRRAYDICNDADWVLSIAALRKAACFFKLPKDASASVDIVTDKDPKVRTAFFVELHRSSHLIDAECKTTCEKTDLNEAAQAAVAHLKKSLDDAILALKKVDQPANSKLPQSICHTDVACDGVSEMDCPSPENMHAECRKLGPGVTELVCVQNLRPDDPVE